MAGKRNAPKDIISRLADAGEEAIHKVTDIPGAERLLQSVNTTRDRLEELTKKVRGIDAMEKRIAKLERRLDELQGTRKRAATRTVAKTTSSTSRAKKATASRARKSTSSRSTPKK